MRGVRLWLAYEGGGFHGWQVQGSGLRTVAQVVQEALTVHTGHAVSLRAVSRTDAGVHALAQVVHFDTSQHWPYSAWVHGLNVRLPADVQVQHAEKAVAGSCPRRVAQRKRYVYCLQLGPVRVPTWRAHSWYVRAALPQLAPTGLHSTLPLPALAQVVSGEVAWAGCVPPSTPMPARPRQHRPDPDAAWPELAPMPRTVLDIDAMRAAAALCLGDHDFRAFQAANDYRTQTWRRLDAFDIAVMPHPHAPIVHLRVTGNAFLKNMVRILVGTLVEVGLGRRRASDMRRLLSGQASRRDAGPTAPAPGLTLEHVELATT